MRGGPDSRVRQGRAEVRTVYCMLQAHVPRGRTSVSANRHVRRLQPLTLRSVLNRASTLWGRRPADPGCTGLWQGRPWVPDLLHSGSLRLPPALRSRVPANSLNLPLLPRLRLRRGFLSFSLTIPIASLTERPSRSLHLFAPTRLSLSQSHCLTTLRLDHCLRFEYVPPLV